MIKKRIVNLQDDNKSLTFEVRQMPATQLESWVLRAVILLSGAGVHVDEGAGIESVLSAFASNPAKLFANLDYNKAKALYDELLACCYKQDGSVFMQCTPESVDAFISDFKTLMKLRMEAFKVNFDFFGPESPSESQSENVIQLGKRG